MEAIHQRLLILFSQPGATMNVFQHQRIECVKTNGMAGKQCDFSSIFKTITVDNGSEFMDTYGMEYSKDGYEWTQIYYCHTYCSSERGSNERNNRMIRRFFPKGQSLRKFTNKDIQFVQDWIKKYPRRTLGYSTAEIQFRQELAAQN